MKPIEQENEIQVKNDVNKYKDVYSAESSHWLSYPKSYIVLNDSYGDTLHLMSQDSMIEIKKWVDLKTMPISVFDNDGDGQIDSTLNMDHVIELYRVSIKNYVSKYQGSVINKKELNDYETLVNITNEKETRMVKILLCDVVGGTLIPIYLEVRFKTGYKDKKEIDYVLKSFKRKYLHEK